ncbi:MAG: M67 family metallopeptidase [candidate division KSB1 bacterium]|nr:M67 family metallopeptidase [candidate division KSB1 bacterium]MDZ7274835.1 M67 family metallopeptidase [candidate division KSB1 bacterium]MDZ7288202.1 M67 family metallopeptidase [candidate division KSB1 bacterium]MDZ7300417.1 M67 family metallopeptidase [candidate division KSB1 bacterium]MDZ7308128.1 M67 family metallopeptidase [candidate division KSB1 bacterium]
MKREKAVIAAEVLAALGQQAEAAFPQECCGLLLGRRTEAGWHIVSAQALRNASRQPEQGFEFDAVEQLRAYRAADAAGWEILGHYHSHPNGRRQPSPTDLRFAVERSDHGLWLILAVGQARFLDASLWRLHQEGAAFQRVTMETKPSSGE